MKQKLNKVLIYFLILTSISIFSSNCFAANVTMNANAVVAAAALTAVETTAVDFGTIIISTVASEVTINASAGASTPSVSAGTASVSGGTSGLITVTTNIDANLTVTYPANATIDDGTGPPANTMTISQISTNSTASPFAATVAGPNLIHVGGVLAVSNGQTAGNYTGTFTVTVNY